MEKTAVIAGATGLVGGELLQLLLQQQEYGVVIAVGRRSTGVSHPKLEELIWDDSQPEAVLEGRLGGADLFIATGTTIKRAGSQQKFREVDYELPLRLARSAATQGADSLAIVSSIGASTSSRYFYLKVKGELEQRLTELGLRHLVILRPAQLLGNRAENRPGEVWAARLMKPLQALMVGPLARYRPIQAATVAAAMLGASRSASRGGIVLESEQIPVEAAGLKPIK
ncbi:NAD(P)H-binding protein [Paenibacillus herberti]|uniref:NAD(P)H-binding protein n=1 Tax=Paenibacillus herberti TaxID=1619309 RepID=UPI0015956B61|nr:NAD(P)H-binding protein [Paenibacillus herberti]